MPLAPPAPALARQTIWTAYEGLARTITPVDSRDFQLKTLQDVKIAALEIEKQLAARQSLRNMRRLMPLFKGLEHYSKAVDILCNGTPYLPWIWAPITLILRVASEYVEAFEQIIKGYSRIATSLGRFEILSDAFTDDQNFQQTLAVFYADILLFHKHAYKFVRRSGWKLLFLTSWGRFQRRFDNILEDMRRHETLVDQEANARNISEARKMRQDIRSWREESLEQVSRLEEEQASKQYQSIMSWLKIDESDQLAIFDSISTEGNKYSGTCEWTLKNPKVRSWLQCKPDTPILWLQGTPGSGKSVISTQLVNFMKIAKHFIIHHFCTYSYASSTIYDQILRSLLLQVLRKDDELVAHVYEECVLGKKSPTVSALEQLLQSLLTSMSNEPCQTEYIWVILDGLDECEVEKQARMVSLVNQITSKPSLPGSTICKVLISSRASPVLSSRLRKKQMISLTDEKDCLERAIRLYASQRLQYLQQKLCQIHVGPSEIREIEGGIAKKADGMFLYARLVLDYLATNIFYSGDEIKKSVNQLPEKLTDLYRKILTQILIHMDPRSVDRIKCIFGWIAFAKRPLRKLEFLSAISYSSGNPEVTQLAPQYILDICGPLIEERRDTTLAFIHVSVKEFLQTSSSSLVINEQEVLQEHGTATITCLLSGLEVFSKTYDEQTKCLRVIRGLHGFHVYATEYWTEYMLSHAVSAGGLDTNSSLVVLAYRLADRLEEAVNSTTTKEIDSESMLLDERLTSLRQHATLYRLVDGALKARSLKRLESELLQIHVQDRNPRPSSILPSLNGISAMLIWYQEAVRSLLSQSDYPGVSAEELELFKSQFRNSAFTCRLNSCPWATLGFESEKLRLEHEMAHMRRFWCTFPGCKYPSFMSAQSLKNHLNKYHNPNPPRKSIRQVGHIPTARSGNTAELTTQPQNSSPLKTLQDSLTKIDSFYTDLIAEPPSVSLPQIEHHINLSGSYIAVENILADLDLERLAPHQKKISEDWFAVFNPGELRVLDVDLLHTLHHKGYVACACFSNDGKYFATSCNESTRIFDALTGKVVVVLQDDSVEANVSMEIESICFSPDDKYLATGAKDSLIRVWDIASNTIRNIFSGHGLSFTKDGRTIASTGADKTVRLWDIGTGQHTKSLRMMSGGTTVAFSPDTKHVAAGSWDGSIYMWDISSGYLVEHMGGLDGHKNSLCSVAFAPNGRELVSGSSDNTIKIWELAAPRGGSLNTGPKDGRCLKTLKGHKDYVVGVALSVDGAWVLSGSLDQSVQFWDLKTGIAQLMLRGHSGSITSVAASPKLTQNGGIFSTSSSDGRARIWKYTNV